MRPVDPVTLREAADILGCTTSTVRRHIVAARLASGGRYEHSALSRADVEALACQVYDWRRHIHDPESYWLTGQDAAHVLGVNRARLGQLAEADRVPYARYRDGTRLYRRDQLAVVAQGRLIRWRHEVH